MTLMPMSHVEFKKHQCRPVTIKSACRMSNLKNGHVALSILRVKGHAPPPPPHSGRSLVIRCGVYVGVLRPTPVDLGCV